MPPSLWIPGLLVLSITQLLAGIWFVIQLWNRVNLIQQDLEEKVKMLDQKAVSRIDLENQMITQRNREMDDMRGDISDNRDRLRQHHEQLNQQGIMLARIDENIKELLRRKQGD